MLEGARLALDEATLRKRKSKLFNPISANPIAFVQAQQQMFGAFVPPPVIPSPPPQGPVPMQGPPPPHITGTKRAGFDLDPDAPSLKKVPFPLLVSQTPPPPPPPPPPQGTKRVFRPNVAPDTPFKKQDSTGFGLVDLFDLFVSTTGSETFRGTRSRTNIVQPPPPVGVFVGTRSRPYTGPQPTIRKPPRISSRQPNNNTLKPPPPPPPPPPPQPPRGPPRFRRNPSPRREWHDANVD